MKQSRCYIYRHIRKDTKTPFYIGKGSDRRAWSNFKRNVYWNGIVDKHGYNVEIMIDNLSDEEAFEKEIEFIKLYKSLGYCEANMTDGGDGISKGYKHTPEAAKNIANGHIGVGNGMFNKNHTKKSIELMKKNRIGKTAGIKNPKWGGYWHCGEYGRFNTKKEAIEIIGVSHMTIYKRCHSTTDRFKDWYFEPKE